MDIATNDTPSTSCTWLRGKTFSTAALDSGLLTYELYDVDPVRQGNAYPRQRNYHGYYWMAATGNHVWHESLLERDCLMWLDFTGTTVAISSQPMKLTIDEIHHYPDVLALDARGVQTVYDIKPLARMNDKVRAQFAWTRNICEHVGWDYRVLNELPMQYKVNLSWLSRFRHHGYHPGAEAEQELLAAAKGDWTIRDAVHAMSAPSTPRARSEVFHLLWTGALSVDMNERLSPRTRVQPGSPAINRQEFPRANA